MKRGYFVYAASDDAAGLAVVASSAKDARAIAYAKWPADVAWTDLRCRWVRDAAVADLPIGLIDDPLDALLRGVYERLAEYPCDRCGNDADVICWKGRALCEACVERSHTKKYISTRKNAIIEALKVCPCTAKDLPYPHVRADERIRKIKLTGKRNNTCHSRGGPFKIVYYLEDDEARAIKLFAEVNKDALVEIDFKQNSVVDSGLHPDMAKRLKAII